MILRAFTHEDMDAYLAIIRDADVQRYLGGGVPVFGGEPHITNWLANVNGRLLKSKTVFTWCIEQKADSAVIGRIDLGGFIRKSMADIAYYLSRPYGIRELRREAAEAVTRFGFEALQLHRIQATVMRRISRRSRCLKSLGMQGKGCCASIGWEKSFHDTLMLATINEDNLNG